MQHLVSLSLGLGNGAVFGALTLAIVLTFRSSGVLNFATGAIVLDIAYVYAFLRQGELLLLIPGLPDTVGSGEPVGPVPALVIALLMAVALGLVLYPLIFRPPGAVSALGVSLVLAGLVCQKLGTDQVTSTRYSPPTCSAAEARGCRRIRSTSRSPFWRWPSRSLWRSATTGSACRHVPLQNPNGGSFISGTFM